MANREESSYKVIAFPGSMLPDQYKNMVLSKWLRSLRFGNDYFKLINSDSYYLNYQKYIKSILNRRDSIVRVAVLTEDEDTALAFSVSQTFLEVNILHYVHTHKDMRKLGIAKELVPFKVEKITHLTKTGMSIWNSKFPDAIFDPFA